MSTALTLVASVVSLNDETRDSNKCGIRMRQERVLALDAQADIEVKPAGTKTKPTTWNMT